MPVQWAVESRVTWLSSRRIPVHSLRQASLLSLRAPPAGTCVCQHCAQMGACPSVCTQTHTWALPNTNIYLRFTVLENLVNNVNDESPRLAENIVRAASLKFSLSCTLGNTHAIWIMDSGLYLSHGTWMFDKDCFQYYILSKCSSKIQSKMLSGNYALTSQGAEKGRWKLPLGGVIAMSVCICACVRLLCTPPSVFLLKGRTRLTAFALKFFIPPAHPHYRSSYNKIYP